MSDITHTLPPACFFPNANDIGAINQEAYEDLVVSIEANQHKFNLLIAICDDSQLRDRLIARYEKELGNKIIFNRLEMTRDELSLKSAIDHLISNNPDFKQAKEAAITVTGTEKLTFLSFDSSPSEQETFMGYLQWTRENFRDFPYSIILWITRSIAQGIEKNAPDFWAWRKGVFRFVSLATEVIPVRDLQAIFKLLDDKSVDDEMLLPIEDLHSLVQAIEIKKGKNDPGLVPLYSNLADVYRNRLEQEHCVNHEEEFQQAITYYKKAIDLKYKNNQNSDVVHILQEIAHFYEQEEQDKDALLWYSKALETSIKSLDQLSDSELIILCQQGLYPHSAAFSELLRRYQSHVDRIFYHLAPDWQDRADLAQEFWIQVYRNIKRLNEPLNVRGWLSRIATNLFYNELRKRKQINQPISLDASRQVDDGEIDWEIISSYPTPDDTLAAREFYDSLQTAIADLPEAFRTTVILREIEGKSYEEITQITGVSLGTVKSRIARARAKLQSVLQSYLD